MKRVILMFPGQGAQYYQMGRELYQRDDVFRRAMARCDDAAGPVDGRTISSIIYGRPLSDSGQFDRLKESNAALLAVSYSLAMTLQHRGFMPERLLGYSRGEVI